MRTTIDLPDDVHRLAREIARDREQTLSEAVVDLIRRGLDAPDEKTITRSPITGLPTVRLGRITTTEDVRSLDDDE